MYEDDSEMLKKIESQCTLTGCIVEDKGDEIIDLLKQILAALGAKPKVKRAKKPIPIHSDTDLQKLTDALNRSSGILK